MTINSIHGANTQAGQMGKNQAADSYSRNIQNQIANAQQQLQELSSNEDMTLEEKMKKRQEIQQKISDLNMQLRQRQMEQRKEKQQAKGSSMDDMLGGTRNAGNKNPGLSKASMTAIMSADNLLKQANVQGSVAASMEGKAGVLKSEIKTSQGASLEQKKKELAEVEQKAQAATSSQISTLADVNKTVEEASKADSKEEKKENKDTKTASVKEKDSEENVSSADTQNKSVNTQSDVPASNSAAAAETTPQQPTPYVSVDIRL